MVGGTDNGRQKIEIAGYDVIVGGKHLLITPITLANLSLNPKLKSTGAGRYQLLSRWWDAYRKQLGLKTSLRSQDAVALQQIRGGALYL